MNMEKETILSIRDIIKVHVSTTLNVGVMLMAHGFVPSLVLRVWQQGEKWSNVDSNVAQIPKITPQSPAKQTQTDLKVRYICFNPDHLWPAQ